MITTQCGKGDAKIEDTHEISGSEYQDESKIDDTGSDELWVPDSKSRNTDSDSDDFDATTLVPGSESEGEGDINEYWRRLGETKKESFISADSPEQPVLNKDNENDNSDNESVVCSAQDDGPGIQMTQKSESKKHKWDKRHACRYCKMHYSKIARHLEQCHKDEEEVRKVLQLPKGSKDRHVAWAKLRNKGDYQHNFSVLKAKRGVVIPKYRGSKSSSKKRNAGKKYTDYVPCQYCHAFYNIRELWQHTKRCPHKKESSPGKSGCVRQGRMLLPVPESVNEPFYKEVMTRITQDDVGEAVKKDPMILHFGMRKYEKNDPKANTPTFITGKMRELGRLLLKAKEISKGTVTSIEMCLNPTNFNLVTKAVRQVAGYSCDKKNYGIPSLALKLGYSLKTCAGMLRSQGIQEDCSDKITNAKRFLSLYESDWNAMISSGALRTLEVKQFNNPKLIPLCSDVQMVYSHLKTHSQRLRKQAENNITLYPDLAKHTLCEINLLNRKRGGEVERMTVLQYKKAMETETREIDEDITSTLSEFELKLAKSLKRVEVMGKNEKSAPILLTQNMIANINAVLALQEKAGVANKEYIFSRLGAAEYPYRGSDSLREVIKKCDLSLRQGESFTWTRLRKHIATITQVIEVAETQQDQLAQFLGHEIRVHRNYYRLPMDLIQKAKVAKILLEVNEGKEYTSLDDMTLNEDGNN